jgi:hypothetical protein
MRAGGWGRLLGVGPPQPSGHAASWFKFENRRLLVPRHPSRPASAGAQPPLAPPHPSPPADLSRRPGRGPPGGRARDQGAPGGPLPRAQPSGRPSSPLKAGLGWRLRWPRSGPASPAPAPRRPWWPAGSLPPPARGCSSQTMEREQWGGRERSAAHGLPPPPCRVLVPYRSHPQSVPVLEVGKKATSQETE